MRDEKAFICDMDGVIYKSPKLIPGAIEFIQRLDQGGFPYLFLTNNSYHTPAELSDRLAGMGISACGDKFFTSAIATANFLYYQNQDRGGKCSAYVIGGPGLLLELDKAGVIVTDENPDYVIVGETEEYDYKKIIEATHLIREGARFIATNSDITGPTQRGPVPACGALVAPIQKVTGAAPYFLGKPNPAMMYWARKKLDVRSANCFMIGDRMDTDIIGGLESGMTTCLVLSGVTSRKNAGKYPYKPDYIFEGVGDIYPDTILSRRDMVGEERKPHTHRG